MNTEIGPFWIRKLNFSFHNVVHRFWVILWLEWGSTSNKFVNCYSKCPNIDLLIVASPQIYFRSEVEMSTNNCQHISPNSPQKSFFWYSKINNFYFTLILVKKNILRLNISMTNIPIVKILNNFYELWDNGLEFLLTAYFMLL